MARQPAKSLLPDSDSHPSFRYSLVWIDAKVDEDHNKRTLKGLRKIDPDTQSFSNKRQLTEYIDTQEKNRENSSIIVIVSGQFAEQIISSLHDSPCIAIFFIHCWNKKHVEHLNFPKLRTIHTEPGDLIDDIQHCNEILKTNVDFSLFSDQSSGDAAGESTTDRTYPIRNIREDQARFLWFYKFHRFLIELDEGNDDEMKREMIEFCRENHQKTKEDEKSISKFENESVTVNAEKAVLWYTCNSPFYRCINQAFVSAHIPTIYKLRYLIRLICRQLDELSQSQSLSRSGSHFRLYRGQALPLSQVRQLADHLEDLISFNSFVSTSKLKEVAKKFSAHRKTGDTVRVLFEIDVANDCVHSIAIADVRSMSEYEEEEEHLISVGSIFRIQSVRFDKASDLHRVRLSLTNHEQLTVNKYIEQTYENSSDATDRSILFGKLLFDMGESNFAIQYLLKAIESLSDDNNHKRPTYLNNLGVCYNEIGEKQKALTYYKGAQRIYELSKNEHGLAACYHNIASYYYSKNEYETALPLAIEALNKRPKHTLEQASTYNLLGCIQLANRDEEAACNSLEEALKIRLRCLENSNPYHPDIGISYQNLAKLKVRSSEFADAKSLCEKALVIYQHNYPKSHPRVKEIIKCLEEIRRRL